ncbi:MAG: hypothetical protein QM820_50925 [Minicystis sp.]
MLLGACILDLDNLTSGGTGGGMTSSSASGGAGGMTVSSSSSTGGADVDGGDAGDGDAQTGCSLLDCSCVSGPTVIAAGAPHADSPRGIAITSDSVLWVNEQSGNVMRVGFGGTPLKIADTSGPRAIDTVGGVVVWTAQDGLFACTLPSCGSSKHQVFGAAAAGSLRDVAFDGQTVVFSDNGSGSNSGKVLSCAIGSCSPISLNTNMVAPEGVELYGGRAFFLDQGNGNQNGNVSSAPKSSQILTQHAASLNFPTGVAVDDTYVYWTEREPSGHVRRCAYGSGYCDNPEDVAPAAGGLARPSDIRIGGGRIYWMNADDGSIMSCPQPGCGGSEMPKVHVSGRQSLQRLVVGASCVFWTEGGNGGAVLKMPR